MNDYEQLIEMMFADGTLDQSVRQEIEGMNDLQKRLHLIKILDKGLNLFTKIESIINLPKMDYIKGIITFLKDYVLLADVEKKKFGEVMTPLTLVKEMLATLPEEVWSNPELKWLDPANGTGPYPILVIYKLMNGLKDWEPDEEKRYKHIIENMIYVCELQPKNMFLYMCAVDPLNVYSLNVHCGSFLEVGFDIKMKDWGVDGFDLTIGNPPFNQMIDMLFVQKSYKISDKILFVHPSTWLLDEKGKQKKFIETKELIKEHLESIMLFNGNKIFGIQLFIPCVFTYINKNKNTVGIKCVDKINDKNILYSDIYDINKFSDIDLYPILKNKIMSLTKENIDNYKIFNVSTKRNNTPGKITKYSHLNTQNEYYINIAQIRGHVNLNSEKNMVLDDFYTIVTRDTIVERVISNHMFFKFEKKQNAENFLNYLKTNFARFCLSIYKNNSQLECGEMSFIPWLDFENKWTDENLFEIFRLSDQEIKFIYTKIPKYY